ncbi:hypothetical protein BCT86_14485 [Vibrio breoganii]|uniref:hypothetical protein n=1 Tax=Vibrio breoganii TaxID=553239 RepID=UPI000C81D7A2|nr:hypothetical protein [Vibrio breoganii]PML04865.1 hypothetical protein BCT86_14485 [Vibrio breoganii]
MSLYRKIKKKAVNVIIKKPLLANRLIPKKYTSFALSKGLYGVKKWDDALIRVPKKQKRSKALLLNLNYLILQRNEYKLKEFYLNSRIDILEKLGKIREDFLIDYSKYSYENSDITYSELIKIKQDATQNNKVVIDCLMFILFNDEYNATNNDSEEFEFYKKFIKVYKRIGITAINHKSDNILVDNWLGFRSDLLDDLNVTKEYGSEILLNYISLCPKNDAISELIEGDEITKLYRNKHKSRNKILNFLWNNCAFDEFVSLYIKDNKNTGDLNRLRYNEMTKNYADTISFVEELISSKDKKIKNFSIFGFWAYLNVSPVKVINYIKNLDDLGVGIPSYNVYREQFIGDIISAEVERSKLESSLQCFIDDNFEMEKPTLNELAEKKVLVVAEFGVADEVRWSRLYKHLNSSNITIVCEPRLLEIFSSTYNNINFVPHKRWFRGVGTSILEYHLNNLPYSIQYIRENYDFVISTGSLFKILGPELTSTSEESFLNAISSQSTTTDIEMSKTTKVGIMWSSSLTLPARMLRYAILSEEIKKFVAMLPGVEFHSLQSPVTKLDMEFCKENNIYINDEIDLYNDFTASSRYFKTLDFVVGPSSLNTELSAAVGTTFLDICNAPELTSTRNGSLTELCNKDQLSNNTVTMFPSKGFGCRSKYDINLDCLTNAADFIKSAKVES